MSDAAAATVGPNHPAALTPGRPPPRRARRRSGVGGLAGSSDPGRFEQRRFDGGDPRGGRRFRDPGLQRAARVLARQGAGRPDPRRAALEAGAVLEHRRDTLHHLLLRRLDLEPGVVRAPRLRGGSYPICDGPDRALRSVDLLRGGSCGRGPQTRDASSACGGARPTTVDSVMGGRRLRGRWRCVARYRPATRARGPEHPNRTGAAAYERTAAPALRQCGGLDLAARSPRHPGAAVLLPYGSVVSRPGLWIRRRLVRGIEAYGAQQVGTEAHPVRGPRSRDAIVPGL